MIGFSVVDLRAALAGGRVTKAQLRLSNLYTSLEGGTNLSIGLHANDTEPASFQEIFSQIAQMHINQSDHDRRIDLPVWTMEAVRDGSASGYTLNQNSSSPAFYGYAAGVGSVQGNPPAIYVEYVK